MYTSNACSPKFNLHSEVVVVVVVVVVVEEEEEEEEEETVERNGNSELVRMVNHNFHIEIHRTAVR